MVFPISKWYNYINYNYCYLEVNMTARYHRIVLKLSGEALSGVKGYGIEPTVIQSIARQVKEIAELNIEIAIVVGGGNIWRGKIGSEMGMDRANADYMGMLATVINSLALKISLEMLVIRTGVKPSIERRQVRKQNNLK